MMDFVKICGREVVATSIATIEKRKCSFDQDDSYGVYVTLNSGNVLQAFQATESACNDYVVGLKTALGGVDKVPAQVNWVSTKPQSVEVEKGKIIHVEMLWNGEEAESKGFTYASDNEMIADFVLGEILGGDVGNTAVTSSKSGKNFKTKVNVVPSKDGIMFEHLGSSLRVGEFVQIPLRDNGAMIHPDRIVFLSSDPTVATVDNRGAIDALKVGQTLIVAKYNGQRYGTYIKVTAAAALKTEEVAEAPKKKTRSKKVDQE